MIISQLDINKAVWIDGISNDSDGIPYDPTIAAARKQWNIFHRKALKSGDSDTCTVHRKCRNIVTALVRSYLPSRDILSLSYVDNYSKFWKHLK